MGKLVSFYFAYSRSFQETVDVKWGLIVLHSDQYMQTLTESYSYMRLAVFQELGGLKHLYIEHLLCSRHYFRQWKWNDRQDRLWLFSPGANTVVQKIDTKQVNTLILR